ncbi:hypothetical protein ABXV20_27555 [Bacillus paranthracis]|uniref:hypothetical protein n=1 Tax=Bacillus cereus group TaxID=86661 RepID=UPI001648028C|nr:hypothetical protein [Bacillus cereus group sp. Bc253]MDA2158618.1 hypothetical protein [Bacillus cereus group sp. Bc253]
MGKDSRKVTQTIKKMEDSLDRLQSVKAKAREDKIEEYEKMVAEGKMTMDEMEEAPLPKAWSDETLATYKSMLSSFIRSSHKEYGLSDMKKIAESGCFEKNINRRLENYYNGSIKEAYNIKTLVAAVKGFNEAVVTTKGFTKVAENREKFVIPNVEKVQEELKMNNVLRYSSASSVVTPTMREIDSVLYNIKNNGHGMKDDESNMRRIAYVTSKLQSISGGRITNTISLKAGQVRELITHGRITFYKDKGGLSREVIELPIDKELKSELSKLVQGRGNDKRAFVGKKLDGKFLSITETRKAVNRIVSEAGAHLKREEQITIKDRNGNKKQITVERKFSTHSFRKGFALERTVSYINRFKTHKDAEDYIRERAKENPKIWSKYQAVKRRINDPKQQKDGTYKGRRNPRELTKLEMAYFCTSVDLGHFRLGIVENYYCSPGEVLEHYKSTYGEEYSGFTGETKRGL